MKERPIIFNSEMVKAILDGSKTQTRRVIKDHYYSIKKGKEDWWATHGTSPFPIKCLHGKPGDRLWVRETFTWENDEYVQGYKDHPWENPPCNINAEVRYKATEIAANQFFWKPSIHMPRWASRINLEITDVRVERVQEISTKDAIAEGFEAIECKHPNPVLPGACEDCMNTGMVEPPQVDFMYLWNSINEKRGFGWGVNPFVWIIEFKVVKP